MPAIGIYFSAPEPKGYPLDKLMYWNAYCHLAEQLNKAGVSAFIVRADSYRGAGTFSIGYELKNGMLSAPVTPVTVKVIFNRDDQNTIPRITDCMIVNNPDLDELCVDKWATAQAFADMSPRTKLVSSYEEFLATVAAWKIQASDRVVVKQNFLCGGDGIFIRPTAELPREIYPSWEGTLVQEFFDSSLGIPGLIEGRHDLRIISAADRLVQLTVRAPRSGSLLANVAQGGTEYMFPIDRLPTAVTPLVVSISEQLKKYSPSVYSMDFMNTTDGYKLIELNSRPGFSDPIAEPLARPYIEACAALLTRLALDRAL